MSYILPHDMEPRYDLYVKHKAKDDDKTIQTSLERIRHDVELRRGLLMFLRRDERVLQDALVVEKDPHMLAMLQGQALYCNNIMQAIDNKGYPNTEPDVSPESSGLEGMADTQVVY